MSDRCDRCWYFHPNPPASKPDAIVFSAGEVYGGGECRRHPPTWQKDMMGCFPLVANYWWCGEYAPKASQCSVMDEKNA